MADSLDRPVLVLYVPNMPATGSAKNVALAGALDEAGWSTYELARRVNEVLGQGYIHRTTPRSWCVGGVVPRDPLPRVVSRLLSEATGRLVRPGDLWIALAEPLSPLATHDGLLTGAPPASGVSLLLEMDRLATTSSQLVCISGSDLLRTVAQWTTGRESQGESAVPWGQDPVLDHLEAELPRLRGIDDSCGGTALLTVVAHHQRMLAVLGDEYGRGSWQARRCLSLLAQYTQFAGWLAMDLGWHARAQRSFFLTLQLSQRCGDVPLSAMTVSCLALQAVERSRPQDGKDLSKIATSHRLGSPADSILWMRRARASAALGDRTDFQESIERCKAALTAPVTSERLAWSYWINEEIVSAEEGRGWIDLRAPARARPALTRTVMASSSGSRDRVLYGAALAQAHVAADDLDQACAELEDTAPFLTGTSSRRCQDLLRAVAGDLAGRRLPPRQMQIVDAVADALASTPGIP